MSRLILATLIIASMTQPGLCQDSKSRSFHIEQSPYKVTVVRDQPLIVDIQGLDRTSLVAIEAVDASNSEATLNGWFVELKNGPKRQRVTGEAVLGYEPLPKENYWDSGSNVHLNAVSRPGHRIVVHVAIPTGALLVIRLDGKTEFEAIVTAGLLIERGEITSNPLGYNAAATLLRASTSGEPASGQSTP